MEMRTNLTFFSKKDNRYVINILKIYWQVYQINESESSLSFSLQDNF